MSAAAKTKTAAAKTKTAAAKTKTAYKMVKCPTCAKRVKDTKFAYHMFDEHQLAGWLDDKYWTCCIAGCTSDLKVVRLLKCSTWTAPDCFCHERICAACRKTTRCPGCVRVHSAQIARETAFTRLAADFAAATAPAAKAAIAAAVPAAIAAARPDNIAHITCGRCGALGVDTLTGNTWVHAAC